MAMGSGPDTRIDDASTRAATSVELAVYIGWRVFQQHCASCHGADAEHSPYAPDLQARVNLMSRADFDDVLANGYRGIDIGPEAWGRIRDVDRYKAELWAYLAARAGGGLGPGALAPVR